MGDKLQSVLGAIGTLRADLAVDNRVLLCKPLGKPWTEAERASFHRTSFVLGRLQRVLHMNGSKPDNEPKGDLSPLRRLVAAAQELRSKLENPAAEFHLGGAAHATAALLNRLAEVERAGIFASDLLATCRSCDRCFTIEAWRELPIISATASTETRRCACGQAITAGIPRD